MAAKTDPNTLVSVDESRTDGTLWSAPAGAMASERTTLMGGILELNPSATPDYLSQFSDNALRLYLQHLRASASPRGRQARWVRPGETPGIMVRQSRS